MHESTTPTPKTVQPKTPQPPSTANEAPDPVTVDPSILSSEQRKAIAREVLLEISSAKADCPESRNDCPNEDCSFIGNHFAWGASQVNIDLAIAAQCESTEDIYPGDESFCTLLRSPEYWKLRQTFIEEAESGNSYALLMIVWRAYNAGLVSPDRLIPDSGEVRREQRMRSDEAKRSSRAYADAAKLVKELKEAEVR
jgi:hypothetical protein